mmetsp:Transcript_116778/g.225170  ORF Transcript_116778/g.225170 Transcript_116778/m.225170 type:complete len:437 (+) Transcript_116778:115-1425(+)
MSSEESWRAGSDAAQTVGVQIVGADEADAAQNLSAATQARPWEATICEPPPPPVPHDMPRRNKNKKMRLYKLWPADNRFCCLGFGMTGAPSHMCTAAECCQDSANQCYGTRWSDACQWLADHVEGHDCINRPMCTSFSIANICAWTCILMPSSVYFVFAMPFWWTKVHFLLPLVALFFFFMTVGCLLAACFSDPGIIPRREVILATGSAKRLQDELGFNVLGEPAEPLQQGARNGSSRLIVPMELRDQGYRWCSTCNIVRPPRASHCIECDNCVLRFDHHCPFINNCVGQRNYLFFMGFTTSVSCLALTVIPFLLWYLIVGLALEANGKQEPAYQVDNKGLLQGVLITLAAAGGLVALFVIGLWVYHVFLICSGMTTKEHWKGRRVKDQREELTIFDRRGPRLFNPRALVEAVSVEKDGRQRWQLNEQDNEVQHMV